MFGWPDRFVIFYEDELHGSRKWPGSYATLDEACSEAQHLVKRPQILRAEIHSQLMREIVRQHSQDGALITHWKYPKNTPSPVGVSFRSRI